MYQESNNNNTISWLKIVVKILLAFLLIILSIKLITIVIDNRNASHVESNMTTNLETMMIVAKEYFNDDTLPSEVGKSVKVTLEDLIKDKKISDVKDAKGNKCDVKESFIKATKLDKEYQIKAYLVCGSETDYLNDLIKIDGNITIKPTTTTTTTSKVEKVTTTTKKKTTTTTTKKKTTKKTTTKKVTTTKKTTQTTTEKKYKVTFNSNGGSTINSVYVKKNEKVSIPTNPVRRGYTFVGWYYYGERFNFDTKIDKDYILIAKWTK